MLASTTFSRRSERGFGVVRFLVLAGGAVLVLGLGVLYFGPNKCVNSRNGIAKAAIATLSGYVMSYQASHAGKLPASIDQLIEAKIINEEIATDPWGNKYQLVVPAKRSKEKYDLYSLGEDVEDESDDPGNWGE